MEKENSALLSQQFPRLSFAHEADKWLESIKGKNVLDQLRERRITKVGIRAMFCEGGLYIGYDNNFSVGINDINETTQDAFIIGHEIGHTFHFDLTQNPPRTTLLVEHTSEELYNIIESFCDEFSEKWLTVNGEKNIEERCKNQRELLK